MKQSCRTCAHYDLEYVKSSTGRVRSYSVAACKWNESVVLPSSMTDGFRPLTASYMKPIDGTDCACWVRAPKSLPATTKGDTITERGELQS